MARARCSSEALHIQSPKLLLISNALYGRVQVPNATISVATDVQAIDAQFQHRRNFLQFHTVQYPSSDAQHRRELMPPRAPTCCKAVRLQLLAPSDPIWVSSEVLSCAFQQFCSITRPSRRYGSSVPGPMESRRRTGKRRMTHVSEAVPSPAHNIGSLWGSFWENDRTKWQWQAPTPRPPTQEKRATLPAWLLEWDTTPQKESMDLVGLGAESFASEEIERVKGDLCRFQEAIRGSSDVCSITKISTDFALLVKKNLSLGLFPQEELESTLRCVSEALKMAHPSEEFTSHLCLAFYNAVWDGIANCKVFGPAEIDGGVMNQMLSFVSSLSFNEGVHVLAQKILHSMTDIQMLHMKESLNSLVRGWTESWIPASERRTYIQELQSAESLVAEAEKSVANARKSTMALEEGLNDIQALEKAQEAILNARTAVLNGIDATVKVHEVMLPKQVSVKALARALEKIPAEVLLELIPIWSKQLLRACERSGERAGLQITFFWMSTVAQLPNVGYELFIQTWRQVDPRTHISPTRCSEVILEHWISQGKVKKASLVRNTFGAFAMERRLFRGCENFARLLLALDIHREMSFTKTRELFGLLHRIERHQFIPGILSRMDKLNMKVPVSILGSAAEEMSAKMVKQALKIWNSPYRMKTNGFLRPDFVPNFIINLINTEQICSVEIWKLMNIPIYQGGPNYQPKTHKPLPPQMTALMHRMATAFAHSPVRSPRSAFRNIIQCLHHLRMHNAPISPEITRAVNHVYVTKSICRGLPVSQERLRYALYLISNVEGEHVARKTDKIVFHWRSMLGKSKMARRRGNVLWLGPIG